MSAIPVERIEVGIYAGLDADDEELVQLSWRLRDELLDLEAERVDYAAGLAPSGTKSGTAVSLGTMIVALPDSAVLAALGQLASC